MPCGRCSSRACSSSRSSSTGNPASTGRSTQPLRLRADVARHGAGSDLPRIWYHTVTGIRLPVAAPRTHPPQFWHDAVASYVGFVVRIVRGPERSRIIGHAVGRANVQGRGRFEWRDPLPGILFGLAHLRHPRALIRLFVRDEWTPTPSPTPAFIRRTQRKRSSGDGLRKLSRLLKEHVGPFILRRQPRRTDLPPARGLSVGTNGSLGPVPPTSLAVAMPTAYLGIVRWRGRSGDISTCAAPSGQGHLLLVQDQPRACGAAPAARPRHRCGGDLTVRAVAGDRARAAGRPDHLQRAGVGRLDPPGHRSRRPPRQRQLRADAALIARLAAEQCAELELVSRCSGMWGGQFGIAADSPHVDATVRRAWSTRPWRCAGSTSTVG